MELAAVFQKQDEHIFVVPCSSEDVFAKTGSIVSNPDAIEQFKPIWRDDYGVTRSQRYLVTLRDKFRGLSPCEVLNVREISE